MKHVQIIEQAAKDIGDQIGPTLSYLLHLTPSDKTLPPSVPGYWNGWVGDDLVTFPQLRGFIGCIDTETTGLTHHDSVTHAVAMGVILGKPVAMIWVPATLGDRLPVFESTIGNWNQPFDRKFYQIDGGIDTNYHIDLMGLALAVRGRPGDWSIKYGHERTWERYTLTDMKLKTALKEYLGVDIDKSVRDMIVAGTADDASIAQYCWEDVIHTVMVLPIVLGEYLAMAPNPLSIWGHMMRHRFVLPMSDKFHGYYERSEAWYQSELAYQSSVLWDQLLYSTYSDEPCHVCLRNQFPKQSTITTRKVLPVVSTDLPDVSGMVFPLAILVLSLPPLLIMGGMRSIPEYFAKIQFEGFKPASAPTALVMQLNWLGKPLLYDRKNRNWYTEDEILPNKSEPDKKLQTPLCKEYETDFKEDGAMTTDNLPPKFRASMQNVVKWRMFRKRIQSLALTPDNYLIPEYAPTGTLSCRSTDKVTLLIGSPKFSQGGSEFMSFIEARPGWVIVQADLDSAELVLAGTIGLMYTQVKREDGIPFTQASLNGTKEDGTDMHSLTAKDCGVTRTQAKNAIYGGQYGQGVEARVRFFQTKAKVSKSEARVIADRFKASFVDGLAKPYFDGVKVMAANRSPSLLLARNMPQAYEHAADREGYTSIINHNIQTLGVDWLDCLQALIWLNTKANQVQLILTRHDELVYHCRKEYVPTLVSVMQECHRIVKMAILERAGVTAPSEQWLRFSSVDVNPRYLKTPDADPNTVTTQFT